MVPEHAETDAVHAAAVSVFAAREAVRLAEFAASDVEVDRELMAVKVRQAATAGQPFPKDYRPKEWYDGLQAKADNDVSQARRAVTVAERGYLAAVKADAPAITATLAEAVRERHALVLGALATVKTARREIVTILRAMHTADSRNISRGVLPDESLVDIAGNVLPSLSTAYESITSTMDAAAKAAGLDMDESPEAQIRALDAALIQSPTGLAYDALVIRRNALLAQLRNGTAKETANNA
jgi:hypothetical protein